MSKSMFNFNKSYFDLFTPYALTLVATESYMFDISGSFISISRQIKKTSKSVPNVPSSGSTTPDEHEQLLPIL